MIPQHQDFAPLWKFWAGTVTSVDLPGASLYWSWAPVVATGDLTPSLYYDPATFMPQTDLMKFLLPIVVVLKFNTWFT